MGDDSDPYNMLDGQWGGFTDPTWYADKDTGDVYQIDCGYETDVKIERVWRATDKKWDTEVFQLDHMRLGKVYNINRENEWRRELRSRDVEFGKGRYPHYFCRVKSPVVGTGKDIEKLKTFNYDIKDALLNLPIK